jgi:acetyltransferase-like isoleucine patch superfamily enzyme
VGEKVTCSDDLQALKYNSVLGIPKNWGNLVVEFSGEGNILIVDEGVDLRGGKIRFNGSNGVVMLRSSVHPYYLDLTVWSDTIFFIDKNCYFNGQLHAIASEGRYIIIGKECLFSFGIWIRTADVHIVYDANTHNRINLSKDVLIGDHVWLGQDSMILKGSQIGSGSIIGAKSLIAGKQIESNSSWGGNPAKRIRGDVFWDAASSHNWSSSQTEASLHFPGNQYIFAQDETTVSFEAAVESIRSKTSASLKIDMLREQIAETGSNRFFLPSKRQSHGDSSVSSGASAHPSHRTLRDFFRK